MLLWNGGCHVHERFSVEKIIELKKQYPDAIVMAHLECKAPVLAVADIKGSTADMLREAKSNTAKQFIVATEAGILHDCNECQYMKLNTLEKVYECLKHESPQIEIDPEIAKEAVKPINRMLELS